MGVHNVLDLISVISHEIPINVAMVYMESTKVKDKVLSSMTNVENIYGLAFLQSGGHKAKILSLLI